MTYLIWYLAIGASFFLAMLIWDHLSTTPGQKFAREFMDAMFPERRTWHYRLLHKVVMPLLAGILALVAWPLLIYVESKEMLPAKKTDLEPAPSKNEIKFSVTDANLLRKLSVEEIEQQERVDDPMGGVPDIPFGHLNAAWTRFKSHLKPQDAIWMFSAHWSADWGRKELREGYVIVRADRIGPHLVTARRRLEDE